MEGTARFALTGTVPSDYTSEKISNGDYLHFIRPVGMVRLLLGPQDTLLDEYSVDVKDQAIVAYEQLLTSKQNLLQTSVVEPRYASLADSVIKVAKDLSAKGLVESATALLGTLPTSASGFPVASSQVSFMPYIVAIAIAAVFAVIFFLLFLRSRSGGSLVRQQIDEEAGKLDVLSVRLTKIDKQLGRDLEQVKQQLERISGR
ncbi:MAG: hypothetical protein IBX68_00070 [Dehalococcoidia bacterium]|nr:hypothetical protein [Dehalococcoidia bacterium]